MKFLILFLFLLACSACSVFNGAINGKRQDLHVDGPPDTILEVDGAMVADSLPATVSLTRDDDHVVVAHFPDGSTRSKIVEAKLNATGVLDIVGGVLWLVPFIGLTNPASHSLADDRLNFHPPPRDGAPPAHALLDAIQEPEMPSGETHLARSYLALGDEQLQTMRDRSSAKIRAQSARRRLVQALETHDPELMTYANVYLVATGVLR